MKAFILAAGFGTRLRPFTNHSPKALVPVHGVPLILYILAFLKHNRINDVVINLHHHGEKIPKLLGNGSQFGMRISYSREPVILGTGGGIKKALRYFTDDMLIINGDVIADFDLKSMIAQHQKNKALATLSVYKHPNSAKFGLLYYHHDQLLSILSEPTTSEKFEAAMFGSFHILNKQQVLPHMKQFTPSNKFCIMRDVYIPQIKSGTAFGSYEIKGLWTVNDSLDDVRGTEHKLNSHTLSYVKSLRQICKSLTL